VTIANRIAAALRSSGTIKVGQEGNKTRTPGLLQKARAIGWYMADYGNAQVSMNLLDYQTTSPLDAFEACARLAAEEGTSIIGSELIGLMPEECLLQAGAFSAMQRDSKVSEDSVMLVHMGIRHLKLSALKPFEPQEQVLEYALRHASLTD
jgi:glutamate formiminotransferase/formiminotetrahydrofolate cyclodeaminase